MKKFERDEADLITKITNFKLEKKEMTIAALNKELNVNYTNLCRVLCGNLINNKILTKLDQWNKEH